MEKQLIPPGTGRKYRLPTGRWVEPGTERFRVEGEPGDSRIVYEDRYPHGIAITTITAAAVAIVGATGIPSNYSTGTLGYDFFVAQARAWEAGIYHNARTWRRYGNVWRNWKKTPNAIYLNTTAQRKARDLYIEYSPMTHRV